ncbi:MAG: DnaB-like helicase C-terminal domain-containing protein [Nocardioides sp.]
MDTPVQSVSEVLERAEGRLAGRSDPSSGVWATGFDPLDHHLSGGFRAGELILLAGPQGLGKTTWAVQAGRNIVRSGRQVAYFCFEHEPQALLERLVTMEGGEVGGFQAPTLNVVRGAFEARDRRSMGLGERLGNHGGQEALAQLGEYAERYHLHRSSGRTTSVDFIREVVEGLAESTGSAPMVVVDYLQKVAVPGGSSFEEERTTVVVEGLKDLALDLHVPVLAIAAADKAGIASGRRMRANHLRGSSALAYEADTMLILNNKFDIIARHHLVYNLSSAERFKSFAVLSIEKNRSGVDKVDMEFKTHFEHSRFEQDGAIVNEQLVDERVFTE